MVLMVSGRCDIVAFYTKWFMNRYHIGYVDTRNPFNPKLVSRIYFRDVDAILFCTKNPIPILPYLKEINIPILFHVTLTPESGRYLLNVTYTIYEQNQDGSLGNPIISKYVNDKDTDWNNLDFAVDYDGKCFEIEGHPVMATQVDDSTDAEIYMSKVTRNGVPESFRFAVLNGLFSNKLQQVGVVLFDNDVGTASRDVLPLKPGDEIEVNGKKFTIGRNGLTLNSRDINVSKYFVQVVAVDMFGKEFKSDIFVINK